jgi:hypothetical protein
MSRQGGNRRKVINSDLFVKACSHKQYAYNNVYQISWNKSKTIKCYDYNKMKEDANINTFLLKYLQQFYK